VIDTINAHIVCVVGNNAIIVGNPPTGPLTRQQALSLAAWLVAMVEAADPADEGCPTFEQVLQAVRST
jgi:hypothetical protein